METEFLISTDQSALRVYRVTNGVRTEIGNVLNSELVELSIEETYARLGAAVFEDLKVSMPQARVALKPSSTRPPLSSANIAHFLIHRSVSLRTSAFVGAIEKLLQQDEDIELRALAGAWPPIRDRLLLFGN